VTQPDLLNISHILPLLLQ